MSGQSQHGGHANGVRSRGQCRQAAKSQAGSALLTLGTGARAQIASTIIAGIGFNGYPWPPQGVHNCMYCVLSPGWNHPIFSRQAPLYGTESVYTDSTIGCLCAPDPQTECLPCGLSMLSSAGSHVCLLHLLYVHYDQ